MKRILPLLFVAVSLISRAQSALVPLNEDYYSLIDRYEVASGRVLTPVFTSVRPWNRETLIPLLDSVNLPRYSAADRFNFEYLKTDSWEFRGDSKDSAASRRPLGRYFYRYRPDFYHVTSRDFDLHVNPVLYFSGGVDPQREQSLYTNTRGVEVRGIIDSRLAFYTFLSENQQIVPSWVWSGMEQNPVLPQEGFWKIYSGGKGVDFFQARGHIDFKATPHLRFQFGHDRTFLGSGYRSLILGGGGPPAWFIRGNLKIWKFNYLWQLNQYTAQPQGTRDTGSLASAKGYPQKFVATHHLSVNIGKKLNIGFFEAIVFSPDDTLGSGQFQLNYLNPVIFYRAIEQQNGSSDNAILGVDFRWHVAPRLALYGQVVLDEFVISRIREGKGWWANKFALQGGLKYVNAFGVSNLDLQGELNVVRPYTYTHDSSFGSYTSYGQPLAHPLGANFSEAVGIVRYQPVPRLRITGKAILANAGRDTTGVNWGGDLLKRNNFQRPLDEGNKIGQGVKVNTTYVSLEASWQVRHNLFVDAAAIYRKATSPVEAYQSSTTVLHLAVRLNIARRLYEY